MTLRKILTAGIAAACTAAVGAAYAQSKKEKERSEFLAHFKATDKNGDGGLSKEELAAADAKHFPLIHQHFDEMDTNKDGKVTVAERDAWAKAHPHALEEKREKAGKS